MCSSYIERNTLGFALGIEEWWSFPLRCVMVKLPEDCCLGNCKEYSYAAVTELNLWRWFSGQEVSLGTQLLQFIFVSQIMLEC